MFGSYNERIGKEGREKIDFNVYRVSTLYIGVSMVFIHDSNVLPSSNSLTPYISTRPRSRPSKRSGFIKRSLKKSSGTTRKPSSLPVF